MKHLNLVLLAICLTLFAVSCKKDDVLEQETPKISRGLYVLNEGNFGKNNTTLTYYNATNNSASTDFFAVANGSGLGDTGNDILVYGGKVYIVMNVSSYIQVIDAATGKSLKRIDFTGTGGAKRQPRYAIAHQNKVLVSSYDNTVAVIDTTTLSADKFITVGANPEQMAISGNMLYVANSGAFNLVPDSTLSVVDLNTLTETKKIKVGVNPGSIVADNAGNLYVACAGDYNKIKPSLVKLNASAGTITKSADTTVGDLKFYNGQLFTTGGYSGSANVRVLNTTDFAQVRPNFVTDGTAIVTPYALQIDETTGDVIVTDAKNYTISGEVFCFDKTGRKKYSFSVSPGINPGAVAILKQ